MTRQPSPFSACAGGALWLVGAALAAAPVQAQRFDMRDCALADLVFLNPWTPSTQFEVRRVGAVTYYACHTTAGVEIRPEAGDDCRGPYGQTFLAGTLTRGAQTLPATAIYRADFGALPCCGWSLETGDANPGAAEGLHWFAPGTGPTLGDLPTAVIESDHGNLAAMNPLVAMICAAS